MFSWKFWTRNWRFWNWNWKFWTWNWKFWTWKFWSWIRDWRWDELCGLGTSRVVQLTFLVPILGYFILFGDKFNEYLALTFYTDALGENGAAATISLWRAYFLYFGFCSLALASLLFNIKCPEPVKIHGTSFEYVDREQRTLFGYRKAQLQDYVRRHIYSIARKGKNWLDYDAAQSLDSTNSQKAMNDEGAKHWRSVRDTVKQQDEAVLMADYFYILIESNKSARTWTTWLYGVGFALIGAPTLWTFGQVFLAAAKTFWRFLLAIFS